MASTVPGVPAPPRHSLDHVSTRPIAAATKRRALMSMTKAGNTITRIDPQAPSRLAAFVVLATILGLAGLPGFPAARAGHAAETAPAAPAAAAPVAPAHPPAPAPQPAAGSARQYSIEQVLATTTWTG